MDKIKELIEQLGSKELADKIMESLEEYKAVVRDEINEEFKQRTEKVKEVCIEEIDAYKKELGRKVGIWLESKQEQIEQKIAKQVAIKDSAAESKLQAIASLLEGVEVDVEGQNADLQAAKKQVGELQEQLKKTRNDNKVLVEKASRSHAIAEKTLERNKVLSKEVADAVKLLEESKGGKPKPIEEDKEEEKEDKTIEEGKEAEEAKEEEKEETITEGRKKPESKVTRRSSAQQVAKPQQPEEEEPANINAMGYSPSTIAASMMDE